MRIKALFVAAVVSASFSLPLTAAETHWSYEGEAGPEHWGDLAPEFHLCKDGKQQSGIDIPGVTGAEDLPTSASAITRCR